MAGSSKIEASYDGKIKIVNKNVVKNSDGELIAMSRNMQIVITDNKGQERATYRITYGARLRVDEGATVKRGDRLAEWNPNALPVLTDVEGTVKYEDLVFGVTVREVADEKTGVSSKVVMDSRGTGCKNAPELRPTIVILDKKGKPVQLPGRRRGALRDFARRHSVGGRRLDGACRRRPGAYPDRRRQDPRHHGRSAARGGAVRSPQAQGSGRAGRDRRLCRVRQGLQEQAPRHRSSPKNDKLEPSEYLIPKGRHISVREGDYVEKGDYIVEGNPSPHDILRIKGMEELAIYLVKEIQDVYRLQGVKINDKHIEVICRQMMQKLEITEGGETTLIAGEHVDAAELEAANKKATDDGHKPAEGRAILLGITKASLQTRSVFSAASFQETTRVLTDAAVNGKVDMLEGLKENVIVGRLIPAGTGGAIARLRHIATERDKAIQAEQAAAKRRWPSWKRRPPGRRIRRRFSAKAKIRAGPADTGPFSLASRGSPISNG